MKLRALHLVVSRLATLVILLGAEALAETRVVEVTPRNVRTLDLDMGVTLDEAATTSLVSFQVVIIPKRGQISRHREGRLQVWFEDEFVASCNVQEEWHGGALHYVFSLGRNRVGNAKFKFRTYDSGRQLYADYDVKLAEFLWARK